MKYQFFFMHLLFRLIFSVAFSTFDDYFLMKLIFLMFRKQTISLLGLLGALDPYKHKMNLGQIDNKGTENAPLIPINEEEDKARFVIFIFYY